MTQCESILNYLQTGKHLTQKDAVELWSCYRLSGRIHDLRAQGYDIKSYNAPNKNGGYHGVYYMIPDETKGAEQ